MTEPTNVAQANAFVLLLGPEERHYVVRLQPNQRFDTQYGFILHNDLIGKPYGDVVRTQLQYAYLLLQPSTHDLVRYIKRNSQIIFPKDIGYILVRMNIVPGTRVIEAGTGSGGLTLALSRFVRPDGRIYTYEEREDMLAIARKNLERIGALDVVEMKQRDIRDGFDERNADALFLDVREPWLYLAQAHAALKGGGFFGALVPTANQLSDLLQEIDQRGGWDDIEVTEILVRHYKPNAERLRPEDRMIGHTGYLLFARATTRELRGEQIETPAQIESEESNDTE